MTYIITLTAGDGTEWRWQATVQNMKDRVFRDDLINEMIDLAKDWEDELQQDEPFAI